MQPTHSISADLDRAEVYFAIGGYWDTAAMRQFLFDLGEAAKPLMKQGKPFSALGDFTGFVPQDRETSNAIRDSISAGARNGLRRFAVLSASPLVRMQYRRIAQAVEVDFFDDRAQAAAWLRARD
ncbi:MAG: STAS/SEC14 domain-containing protein [Erythrobacter sp.]